MSAQPFEGGELFEQAADYFSDVFPGAIINTDEVPIPAEAQSNLIRAGLCAAEIVDTDNSYFIATFVVYETVYTRAIGAIYDDEADEVLAHGSHEQAIDDLMTGTFDEKWSTYLSRQQG